MKGFLRVFGMGILVSFVTTLEASRFAGVVVELWDAMAPRAGGVVRYVGRTPALELLSQEEMAVVTMSRGGAASRVSPTWTPKVWMPGVVDAESAAGMRPYSRGGMLRRTPALLRPYHIEPRLPGLVAARWMSTKAYGDDDAETRFRTFANPTKDTSFKNLFKNPDNKALLISFLNNMLERTGDEEITDVEIHDGELPPRTVDEKHSILDVFCRDKAGHHYIVEMEKDIHKQHTKEGYFKRVQLYAGRTYSQQLKTGMSYRHLKPVVCLVITESNAFTDDPQHFISTHRILDLHTHQNHLQDLSWTFVQIPKFAKTEGNLESELDEWMYMFKEGHKKTTFPKVKSPIVRRAYELLDMSTWSEDLRIAYMREDMARQDHDDELMVAEDRGEERALTRLAKTWAQNGRTPAQIAELLEKDEDWVRDALSTPDTPVGDERA